MGQALMGGVEHAGDVSTLTPMQSQFHRQLLSQLGPQATDVLGSLLQPTSPEMLQDVFQTAYVQPAQQVFERQIMPSIQQRFADANASSSSALNQALAQSASDLSTSLGSQYGQLYQNDLQKQLQAFGLLSPFATGQFQVPLIQQQQGILGPLLSAAGTLGGAALMGGGLGGAGAAGAGAAGLGSLAPLAALAASSKKIKENIKDYKKGIKDLMKFEVKQYDYIKEFGGGKEKVGLIAEDLPKELTAEKEDVLCVDLYGVMGVMINAIQDMNKRLEKLEKK